MLLALKLFWCLAALELAGLLIPSLRARRVAAGVFFLPIVSTSLWLLVSSPSLFTSVLAFITVYRLVTLARVVVARIHETYLRRAALQAALWLVGVQVLASAIWILASRYGIDAHDVALGISYVALGMALVLCISTIRHILTTRPPKPGETALASANLPTLTVAIPARNETDDLEECLASVIASDYPKLEVLVLDDCSQNKRTPEIIRSFAHDGVRFLQGRIPEDNWLAKNQAYQQLYEAANGELVLFCGVDVRLEPQSLRLLVAAMQHKRKSMISIIPRNIVPTGVSWRDSTLVQPMRYAWELSLPRRLFHRPPVLSTCWVIRRDIITAAGGFAAVSRSIVPEVYFARTSVVHDGYSLMQSSDAIGITSNKSLREQRSTAIRVQYPRVHRRVELVMLLAMAELAGVLLPYALFILSLCGVLPHGLLLPSALTVGLLTVAYNLVVALTYRRWLARALITLPFAVALDVALLHASMIGYEFFEVLWKGRNVCIPVMRVTDQLPPLLSAK